MRRDREHRHGRWDRERWGNDRWTRERWASRTGGYFHGPRLRKKIFVWFGISIAVTAAVVMGFASRAGVFVGGASVTHARTFLSGQFAAVWSDSQRRNALATDLARDLDLTVQLTDDRGAVLGSFGKKCESSFVSTPIEHDKQVVGHVDLCDLHRHHPSFFIAIGVVIAMLWGASGAIAHRLVRPLSELARVAQDIGRGQLASRVSLSPRHGMEFVMVGNVINEMASRIEKQLADQRALLATVSHEIRTPLSRMRLLIEFARQKAEANLARLAELRSALGKDAASAAPPGDAVSGSAASGSAASGSAASTKGPLDEMAQLEREVTEIDALVSDLLASSRIDFTALTRTQLDAVEVAKNALERTMVDASRLDVSGGPIKFSGDATLVARAVSNLLENAKRHAGGVETLRVEARSGVVAFVVEDGGPGFAPGDEKRVFEPFYKRPSIASNAEESVGLGLALVKKIAEAHDGRVFAENRESGGARVGVEFAR